MHSGIMKTQVLINTLLREDPCLRDKWGNKKPGDKIRILVSLFDAPEPSCQSFQDQVYTYPDILPEECSGRLRVLTQEDKIGVHRRQVEMINEVLGITVRGADIYKWMHKALQRRDHESMMIASAITDRYPPGSVSSSLLAAIFSGCDYHWTEIIGHTKFKIINDDSFVASMFGSSEHVGQVETHITGQPSMGYLNTKNC